MNGRESEKFIRTVYFLTRDAFIERREKACEGGENVSQEKGQTFTGEDALKERPERKRRELRGAGGEERRKEKRGEKRREEREESSEKRGEWQRGVLR